MKGGACCGYDVLFMVLVLAPHTKTWRGTLLNQNHTDERRLFSQKLYFCPSDKALV